MRKIPVPVAVGLVVLAVAVLAFAVYSTFGKASGDSGDVKSITAELTKNNPKGAPEVPADQTPAAMGTMPGKGKRVSR